MGEHLAHRPVAGRGSDPDCACGKDWPCAHAFIEARVPRDLNPWAGVAVLALHSHTAEEACDERCSVYER